MCQLSNVVYMISVLIFKPAYNANVQLITVLAATIYPRRRGDVSSTPHLRAGSLCPHITHSHAQVLPSAPRVSRASRLQRYKNHLRPTRV